MISSNRSKKVQSTIPSSKKHTSSNQKRVITSEVANSMSNFYSSKPTSINTNLNTTGKIKLKNVSVDQKGDLKYDSPPSKKTFEIKSVKPILISSINLTNKDLILDNNNNKDEIGI